MTIGDAIQLHHGGGGGTSWELMAELIAPHLGTAHGGWMEAGAALELDASAIALSASSFAIDPIFFGNGDIGRLALCTTVNDLAVRGALPRYLMLSLVLEQGLPTADLARILDSVHETAVEADVAVVAGDTGVVRGGEVDRLIINTAGVGEFTCEPELGVARVRPGDAVIVSGGLGDHAAHVLSLRAGLGLEERVLSDCAALDGLVWNVLEDYAAEVHCMRAITGGGLGGTLNELARGAGVSIEIEERRLPIRRETASAAAALGLDPLYLANAGNVCMIVAGDAATDVLELVRWQPQGAAAQIVGTVRERSGGAVRMERADGAQAVVEMRYGAEPPRLF
jgi:hydrogenase expression/formation protein HypE